MGLIRKRDLHRVNFSRRKVGKRSWQRPALIVAAALIASIAGAELARRAVFSQPAAASKSETLRSPSNTMPISDARASAAARLAEMQATYESRLALLATNSDEARAMIGSLDEPIVPRAPIPVELEPGFDPGE